MRASAALADTFARTTARVPREWRGRAMRSPLRRPITDQIFRGMAREFDPAAARDLEAVIRWNVGSNDYWHLVIGDGRCRARRAVDVAPTMTIALDHVTLLELVSGVANGPQLFVTGRMRVQGDLMLAQRLMGMFRMPGAHPVHR